MKGTLTLGTGFDMGKTQEELIRDEAESIARLNLTSEQRANQKARRGCEAIYDMHADWLTDQQNFILALDDRGLLKASVIMAPDDTGALRATFLNPLTRKEDLLKFAEQQDWVELNRQVDITTARLDKNITPEMFPASKSGLKKVEELSGVGLRLQKFKAERGPRTIYFNVLLPFDEEPVFGPKLFKTAKVASAYAYCENSLYSVMRKRDLVRRLGATHGEIIGYFRTMVGTYWEEKGTWNMGHFVDSVIDLGEYVAVRLNEEANQYLLAKINQTEPLPHYNQYALEAGGRENGLKNMLLRWRGPRHRQTKFYLVKTLLRRIGLTDTELKVRSKGDMVGLLDKNLKAIADTWVMVREDRPKELVENFESIAEGMKRAAFLGVKVQFRKKEPKELIFAGDEKPKKKRGSGRGRKKAAPPPEALPLQTYYTEAPYNPERDRPFTDEDITAPEENAAPFPMEPEPPKEEPKEPTKEELQARLMALKQQAEELKKNERKRKKAED